MNTHDINLPPLRRPQVPRIDADIALADIRRLADWCEKTARSYARAAIEAVLQRRGVNSTHTLGEPVGYIMPTALKQLKAGGNAIASGVNQGWDVPIYTAPQAAEPDEERLAMEAVMKSVDPATWPGLTPSQRCALGRFAKPQPAETSGAPTLHNDDRGAQNGNQTPQPAEPVVMPSDADIDAIARQFLSSDDGIVLLDDHRGFARALLARYSKGQT